MDDAGARAKRTLDAKCQKADLKTVCQSQSRLTVEQKGQLEAPLCKCEPLFDGQLGRWQGQEVKLELNEGAKPCHSRACNIPRCHMQTPKAKVECLVKTGVLKKVNRSVWAAQDGSVKLISDFWELCKRMLRSHIQFPTFKTCYWIWKDFNGPPQWSWPQHGLLSHLLESCFQTTVHCCTAIRQVWTSGNPDAIVQ